MAQTFEVSINEIVNAGKQYREVRREIFKAILTAATIYAAGNDAEKLNYDKLLDDACETNKYKNIETSSHLHKLTKLAIGDNTKAVSAMVHVIKVALAFQVTPDNAIDWLVGQGGFQKVRTTYDSEGNPKAVRSVSTPLGLADKANIARDLLKNKILCRVGKALKDTVERVEEDTQRIFIGIQQPDGSLVIQAIVSDEELLQAALVKYASNQAHDVIQEAEHQFEAEKSEYLDLRKTPQELKVYVKTLSKGDINNDKNPTKAEGFFQDALDELEHVIEKDQGSIACYLDRDFDASVTPDPENLPRLRNSKSLHNQMPLVRPTKERIIKRVLIARIAEQRRPNKAVDMRGLLKKVKARNDSSASQAA